MGKLVDFQIETDQKKAEQALRHQLTVKSVWILTALAVIVTLVLLTR